MSDQRNCPRCGRKLIYRYDGIFRWKACPAKRSCGWSVFTHGTHPEDEKEEDHAPALRSS